MPTRTRKSAQAARNLLEANEFLEKGIANSTSSFAHITQAQAIWLRLNPGRAAKESKPVTIRKFSWEEKR